MSVSAFQFASSVPVTIALASLANNAARQSAFIDNSSNLYLDANLTVAAKLVSGTPANDLAINVWFYGSEDGVVYTDNATGADAPLTMRNPTNLLGPFVINTPDAGGLVYRGVIGSVASFFGGILPRRWGVVIENRTNLAFTAIAGDHSASYTGVKVSTI